MIDSELSKNGAGDSGTDMPSYHKLPTVGVKKVALRDVQNDNKNFMHNHQDTSCFTGGRPLSGATKVSGTKRQATEGLSSPTNQRFSGKNIASEHLLNARRRFELELDKGRFQDKAGKFADCAQSKSFHHMQRKVPPKQMQMGENTNPHIPVAVPNHVAEAVNSAYAGPTIPHSLGTPGNGLQTAESDCPKFTSEVPDSNDPKGANDQQQKERFFHLQNFLKHCAEPKQTDYLQTLLHFSSAELSRHAVELEKKAIWLTIEEGKEMQRMKALDILGKSVPSVQMIQQQSKKLD